MGVQLRSETWLRGLMAAFCLIGLGLLGGAAAWGRSALVPASWPEVDAVVEDYRDAFSHLRRGRGRNRFDVYVDLVYDWQGRPRRGTWQTEVERKFRGDVRERYRVGARAVVHVDPADPARIVPAAEVGMGGPVILGLAGIGFVGFGLAAGLERRAGRRPTA